MPFSGRSYGWVEPSPPLSLFFVPLLFVSIIASGKSDCFVLQRFRSYNLPLTGATPEALEWMKRMWSHPKIKEIVHAYYLQKERPETTISHYDDIFKGNPDIQFGWFPENWEFSA